MRADPEERFLFGLALQLGCTAAELRQRLSVRELAQWYALYELDPWGETRADIRSAINGAAVCRAFGAKVNPHDLLPQFDHEPAQHDQALGLAAWEAYVARHNGQNPGTPAT